MFLSAKAALVRSAFSIAAVREYLAHYHGERNHQGLDNRLVVPLKRATKSTGPVRRDQRLGGMLNYYYREAA